jgi:hypothetical protein
VEVYIDSGAENQQWVLEKYTLALDHTQLELASGRSPASILFNLEVDIGEGVFKCVSPQRAIQQICGNI